MMESIPLQEQLWVVLYAALSGIGCGVLYDIFREIRWNSRHMWLEFLLDGMFCVVLACFLFAFVTGISQDRLRGFIPLSMLAGGLLWNFTLGKPFRLLLAHAYRMTRYVLLAPYRCGSYIVRSYRSHRKNRKKEHKFFKKSQKNQK